MRKHRKIHRLNLELGPKSYAALEALQAALETSSQAEAIRLALQTVSKLVEETKKGGRIIVERKAGDQIEIVLVPLPS